MTSDLKATRGNNFVISYKNMAS